MRHEELVRVLGERDRAVEIDDERDGQADAVAPSRGGKASCASRF